MLKTKLSLVPTKPGCYLMKDINDNIIYVGKAINLKNRLHSYFTGKHDGKTLLMVNDINDLEYIVTATELEALLLEMNLIKKYCPRYNILLKDDKSYPYIELTDEKYPRLVIVRNVKRKKKSKAKLFGPYADVYAARKTLELLNRMYPLRKCNILKKTACLYHHLGQCLGYCINKIGDDEINKIKKDIIKFLKGDHTAITAKIKKEMIAASEQMMYERALELKTLLDYINITLKDQIIDLKTNDDIDVFGYYADKTYLSMQILFVRNGKLIGRSSNIFQLVDTIEEDIVEYIINFYNQNAIKPKEIIVPNIINRSLLASVLNTKVKVPSKGKYKRLLDMANKNAKINFDEKWATLKRNENKIMRALLELCAKLNIKRADRIELFDNSNLFGTFFVGTMVVFINGKAAKNEYRKYKINDININDDLGAMKEVIYRRYFRVLKDKLPKPDLIIVDGGINQIKVAREVMASLNLDIPVVGLKKDSTHNTSDLMGGNPITVIPIDRRTDLFQFLSIMQEEVHRFTITYHRNNRSKGALSSILDSINGIGEKRKKQLLKKFGSLANIKKASVEELKTVLPANIATNLYNFLQNN